ncbi:MAG TPA: PLP-dependent aminotransferase family protein [Cytophagales bacterium]|nr:PLP-dependent aminotransferase family protein [Cytophagales bacterium]
MGTWLEQQFSKRSQGIPPSFIREILKVTSSPEVISFAGGLPNPAFFPVEAFQHSAQRVLEKEGKKALQYAVTEGDPDLRAWISQYYQEQFGMQVLPEEILITSGSQQALDLVGKLFIEEGDRVLVEKPTYLGAIQCLSQYQPQWHEVSLAHDGIDLSRLEEACWTHLPKMMYAIPNFQNPSGACYSEEKRTHIASILHKYKVIMLEDDPYGALTFSGLYRAPIKKEYKEGTLLMGSFSKIVAPGLRLGWIVAEKEVITKLTILKQASDLHSNYFSQRMLLDFLNHNALSEHIQKITSHYKSQCDWMCACITEYFPESITYTKPEGGMFLWLDLGKIKARDLLKICMEQDKIVFVPGDPFYVSQGAGLHKARFNFSNGSREKIEEGIMRIGKRIKAM